MNTQVKWMKVLVMSLTVLAVMGASDCGSSKNKTPEQVLTSAFEALEAGNVEEWNATLLHNPRRDPNPFIGAQGMDAFKRMAGVEAISEGKNLGLSSGRITNPDKDSWGQVAILQEIEVLRKLSPDGNSPVKPVATADVLCLYKDGEVTGCFIQDFDQTGR